MIVGNVVVGDMRLAAMKPLHELKRIRLQLARSKEFPSGSARHGYEIVAPLDDQGHIDAEEWNRQRAACQVRRFWGAEGDEIGHLVHKPGGAEHARWMLHYGGVSDWDEEAGYRFGAHKFSVGEYVSIRGHDDELHTFVVAATEPALR